MTPPRKLDFIVIGVQKGGTTSLWQYLRGHPRIAMPEYKEAPVFCAEEGRVEGLLAGLMRQSFAGAPADAMLGKAATYYMMGRGEADVGAVAERISRALPDVSLLALLRDPVDRAISQHRMLHRWGVEEREFDRMVEEELDPARLEAARADATRTNSYLIQGEYGRILAAYRRRFPPRQLHVEYTADLDRDPGAVLDRVLGFLGLEPGYRPPGLGVRHHAGGDRPRVDAAGERALRAFMDAEVWPRLSGRRGEAERAFDFFLQTWNVVPDPRPPSLSPAVRRDLERHYRADAAALAEQGLAAPWLELWAS